VWSAKSEVVDVYLSGRTFAVRAGAAASEVGAIEAGNWQALLQAALIERPRRRWRVWLGGRQCSLHRVEPIAGVRSIEEAEAALGALLGAEGAPVCARLATWSLSSDEAWVAACVPSTLPAELTELVRASGGRVHSLQPWWSVPSAPATANAAMCDDESISYWRCDGRGRVTAAATFAASADTRAATLQRLRVSGALDVWCLDIDPPVGPARRGFAVVSLTEGTNATAAAAV